MKTLKEHWENEVNEYQTELLLNPTQEDFLVMKFPRLTPEVCEKLLQVIMDRARELYNLAFFQYRMGRYDVTKHEKKDLEDIFTERKNFLIRKVKEADQMIKTKKHRVDQ
jgi:hypothetical protein